MEMVEANAFCELTDYEMKTTDGGADWWVVALIVVGCCAVFALGVYNGYKDTASGK